MNGWWILVLLPLLAYLLLQLFYFLLFLLVNDEVDEPVDEPQVWPEVSVLVAARNEEENIPRCLQSLAMLEYPEGKLEVLVGNDRSEDRTAEIVAEFAGHDSRFKLIQVTEQLGEAKGKANVLAHLAREAKGQIYFVTDADIAVKPQWLKTLIGGFAPSTGSISGTTMVEAQSFFGNMQRLEWLYFMGIMRVLTEVEPVTAVGNNMAVKRPAYEKTGGYESIPFSVTEDYKLYQELKKLGYRHQHLHTAGCVNYTLPMPNLKTQFAQRRRWLTGGMELPFYIWVMIVLHGAFLPLMLLLLFMNPGAALMTWIVKWLLQSLFLSVAARKIEEPITLAGMFTFEWYLHFSSLTMAWNFVRPGPVRWKGRDYKR